VYNFNVILPIQKYIHRLGFIQLLFRGCGFNFSTLLLPNPNKYHFPWHKYRANAITLESRFEFQKKLIDGNTPAAPDFSNFIRILS